MRKLAVPGSSAQELAARTGRGAPFWPRRRPPRPVGAPMPNRVRSCVPGVPPVAMGTPGVPGNQKRTEK